MGFGKKKAVFNRIFPLTIEYGDVRLWAKKLINTILAEFDFFPSKKNMIPLFLCNSACYF